MNAPTQEQIDRIRAAEHRFCEAIDLKVDPEKYDGSDCTLCLLGQIAFADHLVKYAPDGYRFVDKDGNDITTDDIPRLVADEYHISRQKAMDIYLGVAQEGDCSCGAEEEWEMEDIYERGAYWAIIHDPLCATNVMTSVEAAKREVVAAYMDCY